TGVDAEAAARLFDEAGGSVKVAIVLGLTGVPPAVAVRLLDEAEGHVRQAVRAAGTRPRRAKTTGGGRKALRRTRAPRR
ncbi:MAG: hypothetical protein ACREIB_13665, partial [Pseudomonadota bacterium]